jgi:hypothetical protein
LADNLANRIGEAVFSGHVNHLSRPSVGRQ